MDVAAELRRLAEIPADAARPVASLYLDTRWTDEQQRERVRLFVHDRCRDELARLGRGNADRGARETIERVEARVADLVDRPDDHAGFALFASAPRGLWDELPSRLPFEASFTFGPEPQILPLAGIADLRDPIVVAVVDRRNASIYQTALGELVSRVELAFEYPGTHRRNDWFHGHRFYRLVGRQRRQNKLDAARAVVEGCQRAPHARLVLAGPAEQVGALRAQLPERLRERLLPDLPDPHDTPESETLRLALDSLARLERQEVSRRAERAVDMALMGGMAVLGPADVTLAVQEGRVHALFLDRGLAIPGWHCKSCDAIGTRAEAGCPYCGGPTETLDLAGELARRVLREAGEIHVLDAGVRFEHFSGIAATLRPRPGARAVLGEIGRESSTVSSSGG